MCTRSVVFGSLLIVGVLGPARGEGVSNLRLVPMPKQIELLDGTFSLDRPLILEVPKQAAGVTARAIADEFRRAKLPVPQVRQTDSADPRFSLFSGTAGSMPLPKLRSEPTSEDYTLRIAPGGITCGAADWPGLFYGVQTICQLIRANRRDNALPCLTVSDWPSLRWRCFQDDMTRGPSSTLATLKQHVELGSALKMNLFTYYMEYQFAFKKHPVIGPENGSLEPDDLRALVEYAKEYHTDVLGNQQSFGHFSHILSHPEYADLRETSYLLTPANEKTYELLNDLYSEVCPLLPFPWFNVCCDETWGLGNGPSKPLAEKLGTGAVYVQHVARVHKILKEKYDKRMMMWGDIILQHPDHLEKIPKDTIMLTWGYGAKESFDDQIVPFARSGYEFFVCPGISNWSRILPDFGVTTTNIHHFVRDGVEHGALGMLNTAWEDDGEALQGYKWHGYAWGAECAWTGSNTTPEDFNRRIGAVLFGEGGDHFGQAIELLAETHRLPGMSGMNNRRFWQDDWQLRAAPASVRKTASQLLDLVRPAIEHLEACKAEATANVKLLDYFLFGARRMELIGQRMLDRLEAGEIYAEAWGSPPDEALPLVAETVALVQHNRQAHAELGEQFSALWLAESKPYLLDRTMQRYADTNRRHDLLLEKLKKARLLAEAGKPLLSPESLGLAMPEMFSRRTRPHQMIDAPFESDSPWAEPKAGHRLALVVEAGSVDRFDLPVRVDMALPEELASQPLRAFCRIGDSAEQEIPAQLDAIVSAEPTTSQQQRLTLVVPGQIPKDRTATVVVYLGLPKPPAPLPGAVTTADADGAVKRLENDKVRLTLGPEGGHVYRWEVKALENLDVTMPGETGWSGFSDMAHGHRGTPHRLRCTARGPALVQYTCSDPAGLVKTIGLFAGASWMEVVINEPVGHYWDFDNPRNFAADGPSPGTYQFSNGAIGPVGKQADGVPAQVKASDVRWGMKFNDRKLALGLITPEVAARHLVAPGDGAGGVGIEQSPAACHFVTFAGQLEGEPAEVMERLRQTLDFRNQPRVVVYAIEERGEK